MLLMSRTQPLANVTQTGSKTACRPPSRWRCDALHCTRSVRWRLPLCRSIGNAAVFVLRIKLVLTKPQLLLPRCDWWTRRRLAAFAAQQLAAPRRARYNAADGPHDTEHPRLREISRAGIRKLSSKLNRFSNIKTAPSLLTALVSCERG